ncbi:uncharacterized protein TNCV_3102991 [Trichonephila clavipes]|nr:uncharacterized protein TNCV_3102991 [Trichonephila clavipes]
MDELLTTTRDLELEVNEDDIEELIMAHEDELTIKELQEILNEEHQETQRNVSPSKQDEDESGQMRTSAIKDLLKKWEAVRAMILKWHPNQVMSVGVKRPLIPFKAFSIAFINPWFMLSRDSHCIPRNESSNITER